MRFSYIIIEGEDYSVSYRPKRGVGGLILTLKITEKPA
jgi:hypothetical protein